MSSAVEGVSLGRQVLRRHVNERLTASAPPSAQTLEVFCECGGARCAERVRIAADVYADVRAARGRYVVAAAHAGTDAPDGYLVLDRDGGR